MCTASGLSEITIDCEHIDDPSLLQCSFDAGPMYPCKFFEQLKLSRKIFKNLSEHMHAGFVPMVLTIDVSPASMHSVRIVTSTRGNDTVTYTITDTETEG